MLLAAGTVVAGLFAGPALAAGPVLSSPAFRAGGSIPSLYTCDGAGRRPPLAWRHLPGGTRSLAVEVVDPDARVPGGFTHWLAWNIRPGKDGGSSLAGGAPVPREGLPGFGPAGWVGPCPPTGTHRYVFTLFALRAPLALVAGADRTAFERAVARAPPLARAVLVGRYGRR